MPFARTWTPGESVTAILASRSVAAPVERTRAPHRQFAGGERRCRRQKKGTAMKSSKKKHPWSVYDARLSKPRRPPARPGSRCADPDVVL